MDNLPPSLGKNMDTLKVRQGATLPLTVEIDDDTAQTVSITVKESADDVSPLIYNTSTFTDSIADLTLDGSETSIPIGEYIYQLTVVYEDGSIDKFPDPNIEQCEDDCSLPEFVVCSALDPGVS